MTPAEALAAAGTAHEALAAHDRRRRELIAERAKAITAARQAGAKLRELAAELGVTSIERVRQMEQGR